VPLRGPWSTGSSAPKAAVALLRDAGSTHALIDAFAAAEIHWVVAAGASAEAPNSEARFPRQACLCSGLQDLIDPERKMDAGDWARFWGDRGFSDASEPNDVWDKAFADCAARLFQKPRRQP
jgi:hypothetical protein